MDPQWRSDWVNSHTQTYPHTHTHSNTHTHSHTETHTETHTHILTHSKQTHTHKGHLCTFASCHIIVDCLCGAVLLVGCPFSVVLGCSLLLFLSHWCFGVPVGSTGCVTLFSFYKNNFIRTSRLKFGLKFFQKL